MENFHVIDCSILELNKILYKEGNISVVENGTHFPFTVNRIFYLYDIPGGASRGAHAHKHCHQFLIAASGSFEVYLNDGNMSKQIQLNRPNLGLYVPPGIWASAINFSSGAICLALASHIYDENDYIRNREEYYKFKKTIQKRETT